MKKKNLDVELEPGLDGADTTDSDDPGADSPFDLLQAKKSTPKKPRRKGTRDCENPRPR